MLEEEMKANEAEITNQLRYVEGGAISNFDFWKLNKCYALKKAYEKAIGEAAIMEVNARKDQMAKDKIESDAAIKNAVESMQAAQQQTAVLSQPSKRVLGAFVDHNECYVVNFGAQSLAVQKITQNGDTSILLEWATKKQMEKSGIGYNGAHPYTKLNAPRKKAISLLIYGRLHPEYGKLAVSDKQKKHQIYLISRAIKEAADNAVHGVVLGSKPE